MLNAQDFDFGTFKVMVTDADGGQTAMKLGQLGFRQINLKADATEIRFEGGSLISRQSSFVKNGVVQTAGVVTLETEGQELESVLDRASMAYGTKDADGHVLSRQTSEVQSLWTPDQPGYTVTTTNRYDDNGDGSFDRAQVITRLIAAHTDTTDGACNNREALAGDLWTSFLSTTMPHPCKHHLTLPQ